MAVGWIAVRVGLSFALLSTGATHAADIVNAGFEDGWTGWTDGDPIGSATATSDVAHNGDKSVKLTENGAYVSRSIAVQPDITITSIRLTNAMTATVS